MKHVYKFVEGETVLPCVGQYWEEKHRNRFSRYTARQVYVESVDLKIKEGPQGKLVAGYVRISHVRGSTCRIDIFLRDYKFIAESDVHP